MDLPIFTELIASLGFPIAVCIAGGLFINKIYKRSEEREKELMIELTETRKVNAEAMATIALFAERMTNVEGGVEEIKTEIIAIKEKL